MIYLDNAATTKLNNEVLITLNKLYSEYFMNANSPYLLANNINDLQEKARFLLSEILKVNANELIFTSSGSESNNMIIKGIAFKYLNKTDAHIITSEIEHSSVYESMKQLETLGFQITYLKPNEYGIINNEDIIAAIRPNTVLISIMKVNSELGTINQLEDIYDKVKKLNDRIVIHSDCVQALGKVKVNFDKLDCASFSAHKINGVKGSGLVYKKNNITLVPLISGGEQESGWRAGTSNYQFNIVFAKTLRLYLDQRNSQFINERFKYIYQLLQSDKRIHVNTPLDNCSKYIINFSITGYKSEVIMNALESKKIYLSTKSACSSSIKVSRVLACLPIKKEYKTSALRISFDNQTSIEQLEMFYIELDRVINLIEKG